MLSIVVLYSFVYLLLVSTSLFLFIFFRRLFIEARERKDRRSLRRAWKRTSWSS